MGQTSRLTGVKVKVRSKCTSSARTHAAVLLILCFSTWCQAQLVVYTSTDQEYAEVILTDANAVMQEQTLTVFDAEAAKTVGLERRLVAEKNKPKADVFWNSEFLRTYRLQNQGVLKGATEPPLERARAEFTSRYAVGFGIRTRVIAVNPAQVERARYPATLHDLTAHGEPVPTDLYQRFLTWTRQPHLVG